MATALVQADLRRRGERIVRAFDFARCADYLRKHGHRPGPAAACYRDPALDEDDLRALARRLLENVCRGGEDEVEYSASGGLLGLRSGHGLRLYFVAEEMCG